MVQTNGHHASIHPSAESSSSPLGQALQLMHTNPQEGRQQALALLEAGGGVPNGAGRKAARPAQGGGDHSQLLLDACCAGNSGAAKLLLENQSLGYTLDVNVIGSSDGLDTTAVGAGARSAQATPLIAAAQRGLPEVVELLLRRKADAALEVGGRTPKHAAQQALPAFAPAAVAATGGADAAADLAARRRRCVELIDDSTRRPPRSLGGVMGLALGDSEARASEPPGEDHATMARLHIQRCAGLRTRPTPRHARTHRLSSHTPRPCSEREAHVARCVAPPFLTPTCSPPSPVTRRS